MNSTFAERVISIFKLTADQRAAALEREHNVVVTAGAGSGKTRTLVARYISLLADGLSPRRVAAITFTEKAAREMRSRVREALNELAQQAVDDVERLRWIELGAQMDSARIGTIHSLCAEILRAHPAEAGIDPRFEVLDEGLAAAYRVQIVTDVTRFLVEKSEYRQLFQVFETGGVQALLDYLLRHRLEASEAFEKTADSRGVILREIWKALSSPALTEPIAELRAISPDQLRQEDGDRMAEMVLELLALWEQAEKALAGNEAAACAQFLFRARREKMKGNLGRRTGTLKETVSALKDAFDTLLNPLTGGAGSQDSPANQETEEIFEQIQPLLRAAYDLLLQSYLAALRQRQALDFDDLEYGTQQLLTHPDIRARWQAELDALLVDEFQDTNERQRELVEALAGPRGRLFLVGDARQSIYRFRRADVTVFRAIQERVKKEGGLVINLDITYRAHEPLLQTTGDLLGAVMGTEQDPARPYHVPFSAMRADESSAPETLSEPHVEVVLGAGTDSASARMAAARALAARLAELKACGQMRSWDEAALLFRASTGFEAYENAFEEAGIPFVTVAGRGFYDRPEIRDVLNLLRALADPANDLAMAGLLRSPAFGLSDSALYQLRMQAEKPMPYWEALQADLPMLGESDRACALRAREILGRLLPRVDRIPVAELLKELVDITDARALLAADDSSGSGGRLWRNLDKLMGDAQASQQVNVGEFLEYLATLNDAGAREGEAPAEAQGALRLMTIHKSKGLEFPVVVLADAGREPRGGSDIAYLLPELGFAFKLKPEPLLYKLAKELDKRQNQAESQRLLYVALTRAKNKLLISGHAAPARSGSEISVSAWLENLCAAANLPLDSLLSQAGTALTTHTAANHPVRAWCASEMDERATNSPINALALPADVEKQPLFEALFIAQNEPVEQDEPVSARTWRATGPSGYVPASVTGKMVHKAIELWLFPGDARLIPLLETAALNAGLAGAGQRGAAVRRACELLERLRAHPLWDEIASANQRHHEVPFSWMAADLADKGYIDLLYQTGSGWQLLDFKTDAIQSVSEHEAAVRKYLAQMRRYVSAVENLLGAPVHARMCFLDERGSISLTECQAGSIR